MLKIRTAERASASSEAPALVLITRRATFAAAHVLRHEGWTETENRRVFGACSGDHGHNYVLEVTVAGVPEPGTGMVVNLKDLDHAMREAVIAKVDHKHLNRDVDFLEGVIPTAENLALAFWERIHSELPEGLLQTVRLWETDKNWAEVGDPR